MHLAPRLPSSRMFRSLIVLLLDTCFLLEELPLQCPQWLHMQALHGLDRLCQFPPARKACGQFCAQVNWSVTYPDIPHVYLICLFIHFISYVFIHVYSFFSWHVRLGFRVLKYPRSGLLLTAQDWLASVVNFSRNIEKWCGFVFCYAMLWCFSMLFVTRGSLPLLHRMSLSFASSAIDLKCEQTSISRIAQQTTVPLC